MALSLILLVACGGSDSGESQPTKPENLRVSDTGIVLRSDYLARGNSFLIYDATRSGLLGPVYSFGKNQRGNPQFRRYKYETDSELCDRDVNIEKDVHVVYMRGHESEFILGNCVVGRNVDEAAARYIYDWRDTNPFLLDLAEGTTVEITVPRKTVWELLSIPKPNYSKWSEPDESDRQIRNIDELDDEQVLDAIKAGGFKREQVLSLLIDRGIEENHPDRLDLKHDVVTILRETSPSVVEEIVELWMSDRKSGVSTRLLLSLDVSGFEEQIWETMAKRLDCNAYDECLGDFKQLPDIERNLGAVANYPCKHWQRGPCLSQYARLSVHLGTEFKDRFSLNYRSDLVHVAHNSMASHGWIQWVVMTSPYAEEFLSESLLYPTTNSTRRAIQTAALAPELSETAVERMIGICRPIAEANRPASDPRFGRSNAYFCSKFLGRYDLPARE